MGFFKTKRTGFTVFILLLAIGLASCVHVERSGDPTDPLGDLPLNIEAIADPQGKPMAVLLSGDGGWAGIEPKISRELNDKNIPVVGLDSLRYFWNPKSSDQASQDLSRILTQYGRKWKSSSFILIGYSKGADVLPFMVTPLPKDQKNKIKAIVLLSPGKEGSFDFHFIDWISPYLGKPDIGQSGKARPLIPEMDKLDASKVLCIYGENEQEKGNLCTLLDPARFKVVETPGGHHFDRNYKNLTDLILQAIGATLKTSKPTLAPTLGQKP